MKLNVFVLFLLLVALLLSSSVVEVSAGLGCGKKCGVRCSKAGVKERCLKYCGICCVKCKGCVPSGTYGNKHECACYRSLKNSKGKPKCP
ncbi:PREDICTED: peamaclein-like isoform X2 [Tarenaya hassleriana]|uniref:peamaclein-like isoform X2 n=1 Tax=Tarenaya hassleriana TaxID=28532 RepID=UPI0008FD35BE|nr:PREDICTED: peamaclein-like isoform X2 [Tarenaya hassleriana]